MSSDHNIKEAVRDECEHVDAERQTDKIHSMARQAAKEEHQLGFWGTMRRYPKAAMWSILVSRSIVMEGYNIVLIQSFFAQPLFRQNYGGYLSETDSYEVNAYWQNGLTNAVSVGTIIGAFANGYFTHKFGYRRVL